MTRYLVFCAALLLHLCSTAVAARIDPRSTQLTYQPWAKICVNRPDGNSDCFTSSGAKGACQPSGGGIAVWIRDGKQRSLSLNLVTKRALEGTLAVRIDESAPVSVTDPNCNELGCRGRLDIDSDFIERLKHARTVSIEAATRERQPVSLAFPLAGFAEAFEGPAGGTPKAPEAASGELERVKQTANPPPCEE